MRRLISRWARSRRKPGGRAGGARGSRSPRWIAQASGVEIEPFGSQPDPALTTGALSELT
ncbi:hypothetical protein WMF27_16845 [Sorangium sp. So ce281]|uniref:hypothetical protein n=1 Tax=unclassified Sorangium TaxID=2621164 RepID=UPI003F631FCF